MSDVKKEACLKVHLKEPMELIVEDESFLCESVQVIDGNDVVHGFKFNKTLKRCNKCEAENAAKAVSPPKESGLDLNGNESESTSGKKQKASDNSNSKGRQNKRQKILFGNFSLARRSGSDKSTDKGGKKTDESSSDSESKKFTD